MGHFVCSKVEEQKEGRMGELSESLIEKLEAFEDWSDALDFKIDIHLEQLRTKDPVKSKKLKFTYLKAERVCDRLAKILCEKALQKL